MKIKCDFCRTNNVDRIANYLGNLHEGDNARAIALCSDCMLKVFQAMTEVEQLGDKGREAKTVG